jgi:hypothetical protein
MTDLNGIAERDRLARMLRETRLQLTMTQVRLAALEQSSTLELGRTLVRAARRPWSRGPQLPRDLYRMWRTGGASQTATVTSPAMLALASAQLGDLSGGGERLLSALTAPGLATGGAPGLAARGTRRLAVTGILTARACGMLAADAAVQQLLPHDADMLLESSGADLVLIEAAALLAGSPWAYAVDPAGADRGRRLARVIAAARTFGKPVILIRNVPAHLAPGLDWVAASCDAVTDDDLGVPLAEVDPASLGGQVALREIFENHATAARLVKLAKLAGLPDGLIAGRQVAVLARLDVDRPGAQAGALAGALAASLLRQRFRPAELVLAATQDHAAAARDATAALSDHGTRIRVLQPGAARWLAECAKTAHSPWAAPWDATREYPDTYLLDLACARECSQADAVGYSGRAYAFTATLSPALARRELIGRGTDLDVSDGLRLFSVS